MLQLKNIKKCYKTKQYFLYALNDININFRDNEFVSILGPSGSGKTTLLNIIGGLDKYTEGDLIINGKSTKSFLDRTWDSYRNYHIGFIFQNYNLINHISVYKNVEMALTLSGVKNKKRKVITALKKVGLDDHIYKKPTQLSGGQMQRVAIARALVNEPDIILADEPTGALDSKTSIEIMNLIKEVSKDKLVIMVTHNKELADKYSNRIITLKDGSVVKDSNPFNEIKKETNFKIRKTKMKYKDAIKLSFNNIKTKKARTFLTSIASSIGIIGIALILSISNGFGKKIDDYEKNTLYSFPIIISKKNINFEAKSLNKLYPDNKKLYAYSEESMGIVHVNNIDEEYVNYIGSINNKYLSAISFQRKNNFNLIVENNESYKAGSSLELNFNELPEDVNNKSFLKKNYDLLYGNFPVKYNDVVLIVNDKNEIDKSLLDFLSIDAGNISFDDVINKQMQIVNNDEYYLYKNNLFYRKDVTREMYYNENNIKINICGILRGKKDNDMVSIIDTLSSSVSSIGYLPSLTKEVVNKNKDSLIVKKQEQSDSILYMGNTLLSDNITINDALTYLNKDSVPSQISIYPNSFKNKDKITKYLDNYNNKKSEKEKIKYEDYAKKISELSSSIMDGITIVLVAFSSISLVVSSIMIGIITYISVLERTKEIGILRSIGARKKDITRVFNAEVLIIGLLSGLIGILFTKILLIPINSILYKLTNLKNIGVLSFKHAFILITISTILTLIGGFIPAKKASKKDPVEGLRSE